MWETIYYLFKIILISAILYGYYHLVLRGSLYHNWNRFYLAGIFAAAILIPLIQLPTPVSAANPLASVALLASEGQEIIVTAPADTRGSIPYTTVAWLAYLAGSLFFGVSFLLSLWRMIKLFRTGDKTVVNDIVVINSDSKGTPFSFFKYIFWNRHIDPDSDEGKQIMEHETAHMRQMHSVDRLLVNLLLIVFWINPVFWLVRRELFMVHEFAADRVAVKNQDADRFARMLLATAFPVQYNHISSHFFTSPIKRRLLMVTKQSVIRFGYAGRLIVLPIALLLLAAFSIPPQKNGNKATQTLSQNGQAYVATTDQDTARAHFPGGDEGWANFIREKIDLHIDTLQAIGRSGTVVIQFVVDENGAVSDFRTTKDDIPYLSQLVTKAIKEGPDWVPAAVEGKKVRSFHKQPVTFQIQE